MSWARFLAVAWKELVQLRRDRVTAVVLAITPISMLLICGYAVNTDVRNIPTVVVDDDHSPASRDLLRGLLVTGTFSLRGYLSSERQVEERIRRGDAHAALIIPPGYQMDQFRRRPARGQFIVDASDPMVVNAALTTVNGYFAARAERLTTRFLSGAARTAPPSIGISTWYNPELRSAVFMVPGIIGLVLSLLMVTMTAMTLARERERGTMEQLIVSPVTRLELIAGKIAPYIGIGYVQMTLVLIVGWWVFSVPIVGSLWTLYALALVFISASLALGMVFSSVVETQQQAVQITVFYFIVNTLVTGFMFPFEAMPRPAQWLSECLPLTHFLRIVRAILLRGAGIGDLVQDLLGLTMILVVLAVIAILRFRKQIG